MLPIVVQVRDRTLARVGVLAEEDLADLQIFPVKNDVGTWQLKLPHLVRDSSGAMVRHKLGEVLATPGAGIIVSLPGGRTFSGPMLTPKFDASTSDPGGSWTYTGVSDLIVLADRLAFPDPSVADAQASSTSSAYDVRTGPAESLMHAYVAANIGAGAPAPRKDSRISAATDLGRGGTRTKSARFQTLLSLLQELAITDGLTFDVAQRDSSLEFAVSEPSDLTASVRMDIQSDQLASTTFSFSAPAVTEAIVLASGEGDARVIRTRTNTAAQTAATQWGRRIERVLDQRQTDDTAEIDAAGDELLATDGTEIQSVDVTPSDVNAQQLGLKWWLGDLVTVNVAGVPVQADIAKIRISISKDGIYAGATVGDPIGFSAEAVTNSRVGAVESRVSSLERTAEATTPTDLTPVEDAISELASAVDARLDALEGTIAPTAGTTARTMVADGRVTFATNSATSGTNSLSTAVMASLPYATKLKLIASTTTEITASPPSTRRSQILFSATAGAVVNDVEQPVSFEPGEDTGHRITVAQIGELPIAAGATPTVSLDWLPSNNGMKINSGAWRWERWTV
jgi:hypothetical protein